MTDLTNEFADLGAHGPSYPDEGAPSMERLFDLDEPLYPTYGIGTFSYDIDVPVDGVPLVRVELIEPWFLRIFDARLEGAAPAESDVIDPQAISGGKYKAATLAETVTATDGVRDMDFVASQNNANINAIAVFQEDTLFFHEDALIG